MNGIIRKDGRALPTRWMGNIHQVSLVWWGCSQGSGGVNHKVSGLHRNPFIHINEPESQPPNKHDPDCKSQTPKALPEWSCKCGLFFASVPNLTQLSPNAIVTFSNIIQENDNLASKPVPQRLTSKISFKQSFTLLFAFSNYFQADPQFSSQPSDSFSILEAVGSFTGFIWAIGSRVWGWAAVAGSNLGPGRLIGKNLGSARPTGWSGWP